MEHDSSINIPKEIPYKYRSLYRFMINESRNCPLPQTESLKLIYKSKLKEHLYAFNELPKEIKRIFSDRINVISLVEKLEIFNENEGRI